MHHKGAHTILIALVTPLKGVKKLLRKKLSFVTSPLGERNLPPLGVKT